MNNPIASSKDWRSKAAKTLHNRRKHLPFHTMCPACGWYAVKCRYTHSTKHIGSKYYKCFHCSNQVPFMLDPHGHQGMLGMGEALLEASEQERQEWHETINHLYKQFISKVEWVPTELKKGMKRNIACHKGTNVPLHIGCPSCGIDGCEVRQDKNGKIYLFHGLCGNRWFTHTNHGAMGLIGIGNLFKDESNIDLFEQYRLDGEQVWRSWSIRPVKEEYHGTKQEKPRKRTITIAN